jgi:hypothetical protein
MSRLRIEKLAAPFMLLFAALPAFPDSFHVTINTSASGLNLQGPGGFAFELSDGPTTTDTITTDISHFDLVGGSLGTVTGSQGGTGSLTSGMTLTIQNGVSFGAPTQTSFYEQNATFGSEVTFDTGFLITPPASGPADATSDFLIVLGPADFPITQIEAVDFIRNASGNLTIQIPDPSAVTVTAVPEPALLAPLGLLFLAACLWKGLSRPQRRRSSLR